jgi:hypothetical protein
MTEAEWLATKLPSHMIASGLTEWDECKAHLAASHCLRHWWHMLTEVQKRYVEVVEHLASGEGSAEEAQRLMLKAAEEANSPDFFGNPTMAYADCVVRSFSYPLGRESLCEIFRQIVGMTPDAEDRERAWQCQLLRDIFGNPFRPVAFSPVWRTDTAVALARQIYESREFGAMPILADALQDAGCDNDDILNHCRSNEAHVRGCWVCDLVLAK